MSEAEIAIIGGSGFYAMEGLTEIQTHRVSTPFGDPSELITTGSLGGRRVAFLARHGAGHRLLPSEVPYRANIYALKSLGVERIIAINAVGSLREEIAPQHLIVPDQLLDKTKDRPGTFFGNGLVAHVAFANPVCPVLSLALYDAGIQTGAEVHKGGSYVVTEGPAFATRTESHYYRSLGLSVVGMTALPEAKLAREAEICYAILACVTDYDCWHDEYESVTAEMILTNLGKNVETAKTTVASTVSALPRERDCQCADALANALVTQPDAVPSNVRTKLSPIIGRYMS